MPQYDIHACLISGQAAPNLLPALTHNFKPRKAIFITTQKMKKNANYLKKAFEDKGIKTEIFTLTDEFDFHKMENELIDIFEKYEHENIALNVTGGTKLMSISAAHVFSLIEKPIFYTDTDKNRIVFISKDGNEELLPNIEMQGNVKIETYLSAYGCNVLSSKEMQSEIAMLEPIEKFVQYYEKYNNLIPMLNWHAMNAKNNSNQSTFTEEKNSAGIKISEIDYLFNELNNVNIINYDGKKIDFKNEETREFLNGIWLETYTYNIIKSLKNIDDILYSVEVANPKYCLRKNKYDKDNKGNVNEFDIVFMAKNKLHIIECKTHKIDKKNKKEEDILYKLETLKDYGGLMTKKMLISYFDIIDDAIKNRASFLNITLISAKDLRQARLKEKIQEWIGRN